MVLGKKKVGWLITAILLLVAAGFVVLGMRKPDESMFLAPGRDWVSEKKVEDYFMDHLHMSAKEASEIRSRPGVDGKVSLRINSNVTLEGLVGNLEYYGFVRDGEAFRYALANTTDTTPNDQAIKVGGNGSIDTNAEYRISEAMSAWELADELLNKPTGHFRFDEYHYFFMP